MLQRMKRFSKKELSQIHDASMELLTSTGVAFHDDEALKYFRNHGVKVEGQVVFVEERHVIEALKTTPSSFTIRARNSKKSVNVGGRSLVFAPGFGAALMVTKDGDQRPPTMEDYNNFCKLVHTSKHIDMNGIIMVEPPDLSSQTAHLEMLRSNILLCDKPFLGGSASRQAAIDSIEMAARVWGGKNEIKNKPVMMPIVSALSPLRYSNEMAGCLIEYARYGQPVLIGQLMMAGSTGPISLPGLLTVQNAELLAGVVLTQIVNPGTPVVYGTTSSITDLRNGTLAIGAPELSMIQSATIQMGRFYKLPRRGSGGLTDAHFPDVQAGMESALALTTAVMSGANFILHACGILSSYLAMSYEKFLVDEEFCGMLRRMMKAMRISPESLDLEIIKEVGIGGQYLTHPNTLARCRTEFFIPELMQRVNYEEWKTKGKKRLDQKASDMVSKRLAEYEKPDIDLSIKRDLTAYINKRTGK